MIEMFRRAHDHKGAAFVEIFQNCNVFNDGAFEGVTGQGEPGRHAHPAPPRRADPLRRRPARRASSLERPGPAARSSTWPRSGEDAILVHDEAPRRPEPGVHAVAALPGPATSRPRSACSAPSSAPSTPPGDPPARRRPGQQGRRRPRGAAALGATWTVSSRPNVLEKRGECERCGRPLGHDVDDAFICSFECTWCSDCAAGFDHRCPNCGGELTRAAPAECADGPLRSMSSTVERRASSTSAGYDDAWRRMDRRRREPPRRGRPGRVVRPAHRARRGLRHRPRRHRAGPPWDRRGGGSTSTLAWTSTRPSAEGARRALAARDDALATVDLERAFDLDRRWRAGQRASWFDGPPALEATRWSPTSPGTSSPSGRVIAGVPATGRSRLRHGRATTPMPPAREG